MLKDQPADSIFTARAVHYNFWKPGSAGLERITGDGDDEHILEEMIGICSLFSPRFLGSDNPFGEVVDVAPINRFWAAIDIRDDDTLWVAEQYLQKIT